MAKDNKPVLTPTIKIALIVGAVLFTCFGSLIIPTLMQDESVERSRSSESQVDNPASSKAESETRFGLSLAERKEFYRKWVIAEDAAWKSGTLDEQKLSQLQGDLLSEYGLDKQQATAIGVEAFEKDWPLPAVR